MKTVTLKNNNASRLFKNKEAIKRLLKSKSYFFKSYCDNHFEGILMVSKSNGIKIKYCDFTGDYPNTREVKDVKYIKTTKTFNIF